jgi:hypothetical protein
MCTAIRATGRRSLLVQDLTTGALQQTAEIRNTIHLSPGEFAMQSGNSATKSLTGCYTNLRCAAGIIAA